MGNPTIDPAQARPEPEAQLPGITSARRLDNGCEVRVVGSERSWIEGEALEQLARTGMRFGMRLAVGLPDLHPGRGHPIGAAFLSEHAFYPPLVGNDIGCGMALFRTGVPAHHREQDRWARRLPAIERPLDEAGLLEQHGPIREAALGAGWLDSLGTIGGGNHFAELLRVDEVQDEAALAALGLSRKKLALLVHSGSRGLGESILRAHVREHGDRALTPGTHDARVYLARHDAAVEWARENRRIIGERFLRAIRAEGERALDLVHNAVVERDGKFLHRKGAAPADQGAVVIPGSRGACSHLVMPTRLAAGSDRAAWSLAHGAGRRWKRSDCKDRLAPKFSAGSLERTALGSRVICSDRELLFEEAPQAYKDIEGVVADLLAAGLVVPIARLAPVLTFKTARGGRGDG